MIVLIPAYEPDHHLIDLVNEIKKETNFKVIVVNDGSSNGFDFDKFGNKAIVLNHEVNKGKGAALRTGFSYIYDNYRYEDGVVTADADGQHTLKDIVKVAYDLTQNENSIVLGCRKFIGDVPKKSLLGNKITRIVFKLTSGKYISDTQTGLRAVPVDKLPLMIDIEGDRYEYEMNMLYEAVKAKINIVETPIKTIYEDGNKCSHFRPFKDGFRIYKSIFKFMGSSLLCALLDYTLFMVFLSLLSKKLIILCNILARIVSATTNYLINRKVVFKSHANPLKSVLKYALLALFIIIANSAILYLLTNVVHLAPWIAKIIVEVLLFSVSYVVQKRFIFNK